ncbi:hypothetical protein D3C85_1538010 [compost metagenome]
MIAQADCGAIGSFAGSAGEHQPGCSEELLVLQEVRKHGRGQEQRLEQNLQVFGSRAVVRIPTATGVLVVRRGQPESMFGTVVETTFGDPLRAHPQMAG